MLIQGRVQSREDLGVLVGDVVLFVSIGVGLAAEVANQRATIEFGARR